MAQMLQDLVFSIGNCLNCFPGSPTLKINSRSFKILRLLGEGGFSYVYLVQDTTTSELFALKKIRCPFGAESVAQAMREVDAYRLFAHVPGVIHMADHCVARERGAAASGIGAGTGGDEGKTVYVLLPYYRRGNLQDMINANLVNRTRTPERKMLVLFRGVCEALREMHRYRRPVERMEVSGGGGGGGGGKGKGKRREEEEEEEEAHAEEDERPLMGGESRVGAEGKSYAHRDIKPGNIMIDDTGANPIVMDLGSLAPSPIPITSHSLAIQTQDTAAEHSTMPYRAPELFDVRTGAVIDAKVDIWSLGCTLYACLVGKSPFEMRSDETGGSLSLCVLGGDWRFPDEKGQAGGMGVPRRMGSMKGKEVEGGEAGAGAAAAAGERVISDVVKEIVRRCLRVEPSERPDIDELMVMVDEAIEELPDDE